MHSFLVHPENRAANNALPQGRITHPRNLQPPKNPSSTPPWKRPQPGIRPPKLAEPPQKRVQTPFSPPFHKGSEITDVALGRVLCRSRKRLAGRPWGRRLVVFPGLGPGRITPSPSELFAVSTEIPHIANLSTTAFKSLATMTGAFLLSACFGSYIPAGTENKSTADTDDQKSSDEKESPESSSSAPKPETNDQATGSPTSTNKDISPTGTESQSSDTSPDSASETTSEPDDHLEIKLGMGSELPIPENWRVNASLVRLGYKAINTVRLGDLLDTAPSKNGTTLSLRLPTPPDEVLINKKATVILTVYADITGDKALSPEDTYIASSIEHLFYEKDGETGVWRYFSRENQHLLPAEGATLDMTRIDRSPQVLLNIGGPRSAVPKDLQGIALFSGKELTNLQTGFNPAPRVVDFAFSTAKTSGNLWEYSLTQGMNPGRFNQSFTGLSAHGSEWLLGYHQPEESKAGPPVTAQSKISASACANHLSVAMLWIQPERWIVDPVGAYYAALFGLYPGWNALGFDLRDPSGRPPPALVLREDQRRNLRIQRGGCY